MERADLIKIESKIKKLEEKFVILGVKKETFLTEASFAMQALAKNDILASCPETSIVSAVYNLALTGLTLNPALEYAYLVPRKLKSTDRNPACILDISYRGMVKVAMDSGGIKSVRGKCVYTNDFFENHEGIDAYIKHIPVGLSEDRGGLAGAYVVAVLADGTMTSHVMRKDEIEEVEAISPMKGRGPWKQWKGEMWIKTVIKRARKLWPHSEKLAEVVRVMNEAEGFPEIRNVRNVSPKPISTSSIDQLLPASEPGTPPRSLPGPDPWVYTDDSESRITADHRALVVDEATKAGVSVEIDLLPTLKIKGLTEVRNRDLTRIKEYLDFSRKED